MSKLHIAVLYGGQSPEHEVSVRSAKNVMAAMNRDRYEVLAIYISKEGHWSYQDRPLSLQLDGSPNPIHDPKGPLTIDLIFPVLHGPNGEDGSIQGLLQLLELPVVGPGILSSAACMDKDVCKRLLQQAGLLVAPFLSITKEDHVSFQEAQDQLGHPLFIKPARMGSSVGVSKVEKEEDWQAALKDAFQYDSKVLIEAAIQGRELEVAVLGNQDPKASVVGEVVMQAASFYDYEAKYENDTGAQTIIPTELTPEETVNCQNLALQAYQAMGCKGLARVDLFFTPQGEVYVNELNTLPGFTNTSMYPKLWEASGMTYSALIDQLISLALES